MTATTLSDLEEGTLGELLNGADFKFVDIGARGPAAMRWTALARFAELFACEPDPDEAARLPDALREQAPWRRIEVIREAIAAEHGEATLYVTEQPGLSSLLRPNAPVVERYPIADAFRVVSTLTVPTLPLDGAAERYGFTDACFVKLDTQGTELEILRSGERLVADSVLGVYVEASFHAFYEGQPLFADIDSHLRARGFQLFDLSRSLLRGRDFVPDLYSRRHVVWCHCLYFVDPDMVAAGAGEAAARRFGRYLGLLLAFGYYDLAIRLSSSAAVRKLLGRRSGRRIGSEIRSHVGRETLRRFGDVLPDPAAPLLQPVHKDPRDA